MLDFKVSVAAAIGSTKVSIHRNLGGLLQPGMVFSALGRLHMITALASADTGGPATLVATIRPKLRVAWPVGTVLEFGTPVGLMRLASDDTGALELEMARRGTLALDLVEAL